MSRYSVLILYSEEWILLKYDKVKDQVPSKVLAIFTDYFISRFIWTHWTNIYFIFRVGAKQHLRVSTTIAAAQHQKIEPVRPTFSPLTPGTSHTE